MSFRDKFKVRKDLKTQIEREESTGDDPRILPYYNLKKNETMTVLLLPDANGDIMKKTTYHAARGAGKIGCRYALAGEDCEICGTFFDRKDSFDKSGDEDDEKRMAIYSRKQPTYASVVVIDAPFEIPETSDGNDVKIWNVPFKVSEYIKSQIQDGQIDPEDITAIPFVIKKTENQGKRASYETSYFRREDITDEELDYLDTLNLEPYDFSNMPDLFVDIPSQDDIDEWMEKAHRAEEAAVKPKKGKGGDKSTDDVRERVSRRTSSRDDDEDNAGGTTIKRRSAPAREEPEEQEEPEERQSSKSSGASDLREKLKRARSR